MNMKAYFNLSYGVYIATVMDGDKPTGCVANSAMQVTAVPATIAVSINHENYTNEVIKESGFFALNVMPEKISPAVLGTFGFQSGRDIEKFSGTPYEMVDNLPVLKESCGHFICKVIDKMETYTHTIFLGEVVDCDIMDESTPMTYSYYHKVVKGKAPKTAPTYVEEVVEEAPTEKAKYVCSLCKYEYDGDIPFEELPDDYVCPLCGQGKEIFEKEEPIVVNSVKYVCDICSYEYDGDIPWDELPDDYVCPICGQGKGVFTKYGEEPAKEEESNYVCTLCKYEYDGEIPFEDLPDDYVCPICGQPKSIFKK